MTIGQLLNEFIHADETIWLEVMIAVDLILGVLAALKLGTFRLSYVSDFLRNDVLFKVVPFMVIWWAAAVTPTANVIGGLVDISQVKDAIFALAAAALVGSFVSSLADLGLPVPGGSVLADTKQTVGTLFGGENAAPPKD